MSVQPGFGRVMLMAFSLMISLILWMIVQLQLETKPKEFANVPLDFRNVASGLTVLGEQPFVSLKPDGMSSR